MLKSSQLWTVHISMTCITYEVLIGDKMKKVAVYDLTTATERKTYEDLLNDPCVTVTEKTIFSSPRDGSIRVVVWYIKEDE